MADHRQSLYHHPFVQQIVADLRANCGLTPGSNLVIAVSGGADSIALLRAIAVIAPRRPWRLKPAVAHIQHHLRSDAEQDAELVAELAGSLGLPFYREDIYPDEAADENAVNVEAHARTLRYEALARIANTTASNVVATAHHADDQLETLLMRLIRGSSITGMAAMRWRRSMGPQHPGIDLIRPMLRLDHAAACDFLNDLKQPWAEDHTNSDLSRWRARLRRDVLPVLKELCPTAADGAQRFAEHSQQLGEWLNAEVEAALADKHLVTQPADEASADITLNRALARGLAWPVLNELLSRLLTQAGVPADRLPQRLHHQLAAAVCDHVGGSRHFDLAGEVKLIITREAVRIAPHGEA